MGGEHTLSGCNTGRTFSGQPTDDWAPIEGRNSSITDDTDLGSSAPTLVKTAGRDRLRNYASQLGKTGTALLNRK